ncbi:penicillin-binding protein activator [Enterovirga sp. DB1703]|uniref:Penicillin-binding protein activator n=2 Tax=Enterovirga aerilata TaxID=2730920 RepID=A0A849I195_9HYPH|nr:penicillin-binding protein activator [Enterovirga sp. DB1703]
MDPGRGRPSAAIDPLADPPAAPAPSAGPTIGTGAVKVALILPLGASGQAASAATSLRNAADLAMAEFQNPDLTILVKDDRGTADGAREAATAALAEGAELILGPLFASAVAAAGTVAKAQGRPVIGFSTDAGVASRGVYLLSFLPQNEVDRVIDYAAAQGRRSFAALVPDTTYGSVVEGAFREAAARRGIRVAGLERYAPGQPAAAVTRLAPLFSGQIDAILIPAPGDDLPAIGSALQSAGFSPGRVKPLGTGLWNDPRAAGVAAIQGGWFASPEIAGFTAFAGRYRARFNAEPTRIATLAYDAVSLAAALARMQGTPRYSEAALLAPTGFAGVDGVFRFRPDGTNERALAVNEVRGEGTAVISPAPKAFG